MKYFSLFLILLLLLSAMGCTEEARQSIERREIKQQQHIERMKQMEIEAELELAQGRGRFQATEAEKDRTHNKELWTMFYAYSEPILKFLFAIVGIVVSTILIVRLICIRDVRQAEIEAEKAVRMEREKLFLDGMFTVLPELTSEERERFFKSMTENEIPRLDAT